jgi:hypothetical protein
MRLIVAILLISLLTACVEEPVKRVQQDCSPPNMIVNGDCCMDQDYNGECDAQKAITQPAAVKPTASTATASAEPKEILPANEIVCDYDAQTLTVLLRNTGDTSWSLNADLSWQHRGNIQNVLVYFNQYQMNAKRGTYRDGKLLFGPGPAFADACTTPILSPGQETRCTFTDVPFAGANYHNGTNEIRLQIPDVQPDPVVEFTCT